MKIAMFTDSFFPQVNGIVTHIINLSKRLADRGHKVYIIAPKYKDNKEFHYPNIIVKRISSVSAWFYSDFRFTSIFSSDLMNYLKKENVDIIHLHTPVMLGWEAIMIGNILNKPLIGTFNTNLADKEYLNHFFYYGKILQKTAVWYLSTFYSACDRIICPTNETKKELNALGFKEKKSVISYGVDGGIFNNLNKEKIKLKYRLHGKNLIFVGRIAYEKNILYLLDCFKLILKQMPETKLIIVGNGPQMDELKSKINKLGITDNVIVTGEIKHGEFVKSGILGACDIFVTASTTETQGISTLEAQANGLVCVGINKRGTKDIIRDKYNGYLVKENNKNAFANKVVNLIKDKTLYEKMKKNTLKEIKKHNYNFIVKRFENEYLKVIKEYKRNPRKEKRIVPKLRKLYKF